MIEKSRALALMRTEYDRLDRLCGVNTGSIKLAVSGRMTSKLGYFKVVQKSAFAKPELSITIASRVLADDAVFYDVIRHEYAHAIVYLRDPRHRHVHDAVWKAACLEVGCIPRATRKDLPASVTAEGKSGGVRPYKYQIRCVNCGAVSRYKTEGKVVKVAMGKIRGTIRCRKCGCTRFIADVLY